MHIQRNIIGKYLTVFLVSFIVQEYVGLHIPDKLVGEKLRLLSGPQDVLSHITHLHDGVTGEKDRERSHHLEI